MAKLTDAEKETRKTLRDAFNVIISEYSKGHYIAKALLDLIDSHIPYDADGGHGDEPNPEEIRLYKIVVKLRKIVESVQT